MRVSITAVVTGVACIGFHCVSGAAKGQMPSTDARSVALAGAMIAVGAVQGRGANPASAVGVANGSVSFGFSRSFGMKELDAQSVDVLVPLGLSRLTVGVAGFGYEAFSVMYLSGGFASRIGDLKFGFGAEVGRLQLGAYGAKTGVSISGGWIYSASERVDVGGEVRNLSLGASGFSRIGVSAGSAVSLGHGSTLLAAVSLGVGSRPALRIGLEVAAAGVVGLRTGVSTSPGYVTAGLGLSQGRTSIDFGYAFHPRLGGTPVLSLQLDK